MSKIILSISGVARSGKNLFCDIAMKTIQEKYLKTCEVLALSYELKDDCKFFIQQKLGIDVWTEKTEEKNIIRPMLVWYGDVKRKQSNGRYWIDKLQKKVDESSVEVILISDVRYCHYDFDEVHWAKQNGKLIHVSKYSRVSKVHTNGEMPEIIDESKTVQVFTPPANEYEQLNDPKVKQMADFIIEWEDRTSKLGTYYPTLKKDDYLNSKVNDVLEKIF
jgi:hypothetical protein